MTATVQVSKPNVYHFRFSVPYDCKKEDGFYQKKSLLTILLNLYSVNMVVCINCNNVVFLTVFWFAVLSHCNTQPPDCL